ncbi:MAG: DnaJ domain-containing protein [Alphaproteobacteria bacterium]|jgi:hypothetical protein|nr:DnaJ domain-containing protein [Alphaproteobacteria bacterium]
MFRKFSQWFDPAPNNKTTYEKSLGGQPCAQEGCTDEGLYRAPKSRYHIEAGVDDWYWFCLIHIRDYNAKWNYYSNMSETEIEQERRADTTWQRPSWPLGEKGDKARPAFRPSLQDPFDLFSDGFSSSHLSSQDRFPAHSPEGKALTLFEMSFPFSKTELKKKYRELVKQHHPDANAGSLEAEETVKKINEAYGILKNVT